jgi:hypothetical protein
MSDTASSATEVIPTGTTRGLRGRAKRALILDLAAGDDRYEELGPKHGLSHQGVVQFVSRNRDEIEAAKRDMTSELAGIWPTDKPLRLTDAMQDLDDVNEQLKDPNLTVTQRRGLWALKIRLRHSIAEECGQLPTRAVLEVESGPMLQQTIHGWSPDRWAEQLLASRTGTAPSDDGPTPASSSSPTSAPEPVEPVNRSHQQRPAFPPATPAPIRDPDMSRRNLNVRRRFPDHCRGVRADSECTHSALTALVRPGHGLITCRQTSVHIPSSSNRCEAEAELPERLASDGVTFDVSDLDQALTRLEDCGRIIRAQGQPFSMYPQFLVSSGSGLARGRGTRRCGPHSCMR